MITEVTGPVVTPRRTSVPGQARRAIVSGAVASVIGAFYYLRIVYYMYFGTETDALDGRMVPAQWVLLMASAAVMVVGVVNLFGVEGAAMAAAEALVH